MLLCLFVYLQWLVSALTQYESLYDEILDLGAEYIPELHDFSATFGMSYVANEFFYDDLLTIGEPGSGHVLVTALPGVTCYLNIWINYDVYDNRIETDDHHVLKDYFVVPNQPIDLPELEELIGPVFAKEIQFPIHVPDQIEPNDYPAIFEISTSPEGTGEVIESREIFITIYADTEAKALAKLSHIAQDVSDVVPAEGSLFTNMVSTFWTNLKKLAKGDTVLPDPVDTTEAASEEINPDGGVEEDDQTTVVSSDGHEAQRYEDGRREPWEVIVACFWISLAVVAVVMLILTFINCVYTKIKEASDNKARREAIENAGTLPIPTEDEIF